VKYAVASSIGLATFKPDDKCAWVMEICEEVCWRLRRLVRTPELSEMFDMVWLFLF
jgi:hypothetical protein